MDNVGPISADVGAGRRVSALQIAGDALSLTGVWMQKYFGYICFFSSMHLIVLRKIWIALTFFLQVHV